ncbi:minor capsid protein [Clostridium culturomicium]|uniref:minor capsid protein n=1 Tax=Clostridium culturomicium TaxID=1499683 RepID=UPI000693A1E6|nr:minor capsid protein [Clostridium culturomicium]
MKSSSYWKDRANLRMNSYHKNSDKTIYKINNAYDKAIEDINKDIKKIFYKFQSDSGMSIAEAKDLLNTKIPKLELESIRSKINGIQDKNLKRYLMAQLNAKAYNSRMTRLEALKESIYINTKRIANVELVQSELRYIKNINEAYYRNIYDIQKVTGIVTDFATMPVNVIEDILKNNWSGKHYSERVWGNSEVLAAKLEEVITSGLMSGKSSKKMAVELADLSQYGKMAAERLIRTETTYVTNMAELESYKELGIDKYIFVATLDLRTSKQCRNMDGKVIDVYRGVPGENLPPLHPWCRSTTRAYFEGMNRRRRARDPETGKNYIIENMNFDEWYQKFVVDKYGEQKAETFQKMIKNKAADRKQYSKYKEILGKDVPKSFTDFRQLKYNDINEWKLIKYNYKLKSEAKNNPQCILENAHKFNIDERKYTSYLFGGSNVNGLAKGDAFESRLGYSINNYKDLDILIKDNIGKFPAIFKGDTPHGKKYEVNMVLKGLKNKQAKVKVGVMSDDNGPRLTTVFIDKLKESDIEYERY